MGAIHVLDKLLVERIAAGEVIERPASVVKETLENAVDAGATSIEVDIEEGGKKLIRVSDDGCGMDADDLALAFASHATSKIESLDDLFAVRTMGFRGEALSSIASISHVRAVSRRRDADAGWELAIDGGAASDVKACPSAPGTVLEISNLFFNIPVRRKFMRADSTEAGHVTDAVTRLALAHPEVSWRLTHNRREVLKTVRVQGLRARLADILGREIADGLIETSYDDGYVKIRGFLSKPSLTRSNSRQQFLFLNRRFIRDRLLLHALGSAYADFTARGRYPVVALYIALSPSEVDVNVHPTKLEVRFRNSGAVHHAVSTAVKEALQSADLTPPLTASPRPRAGTPAFTSETRESARKAVADYFRDAPARQGSRPSIENVGETSFLPPSPPRETAGEGVVQEELPSMRTPAPAVGRPTVQIHDAYIVVETSDGFLVIDQHALHERILYEQMRKELARAPLASQRLLMPIPLELSRAEVMVLQGSRDILANLGFEVGEIGKDTAAVYAYPSILARADIAALVTDMVGELASDESATASKDRLDAILHLLSCHAAVKAGDRLTDSEIQSLLEHRELAENPHNCPHGRPVSLNFSVRDIEKQFGRT